MSFIFIEYIMLKVAKMLTTLIRGTDYFSNNYFNSTLSRLIIVDARLLKPKDVVLQKSTV